MQVKRKFGIENKVKLFNFKESTPTRETHTKPPIYFY